MLFLFTPKKYFLILLFLFVSFGVTYAAGDSKSKALLVDDLSLGSRGKEVETLQNFLAKDTSLYPEGIISGFFGSRTRSALIRFQIREHIVPALGYFGRKSRARVLELLQGAGDNSLLLVATSTVSRPDSTGASSSTIPQFVSLPRVTIRDFNGESIFGLRAPYQLMFNWATDIPTTVSAFRCDPSLRASGALGQGETYWADTGGDYVCDLTLSTRGGGKVTRAIPFSISPWLSLGGARTIPFGSGGRLGEIIMYNGSRSTTTIWHLGLKLTDTADIPMGRGGQEFFVVLRDGTTTADTLLSRTGIILNTDPPIDAPRIILKTIYVGTSLAPREERKMSLWLESLPGLLRGGALTFEVNDAVVSDRLMSVHGTSTLILVP